MHRDTAGGRAPRPPRGDPNTKTVRLPLTADEWRKLRLRAAEEDADMAQIVAQIVSRELENKRNGSRDRLNGRPSPGLP